MEKEGKSQEKDKDRKKVMTVSSWRKIEDIDLPKERGIKRMIEGLQVEEMRGGMTGEMIKGFQEIKIFHKVDTEAKEAVFRTHRPLVHIKMI